LGGWLTGQFGWRVIFFMNVPVGLLPSGSANISSLANRPGERQTRFDMAGAAAWICGLFALLLALNQGHAYGWTSIPIICLLGVAALLLAGFLLIEQRVEHPMLDLTLFESRPF